MKTRAANNILISAAIILFALVTLRSAWMCDDAYITLRTVDNLVHGYGLTWNPAERVQVYTDPLWMFLLSGVYFFTREAYYTSITLSVLVSVAAVAWLSFGIAKSLSSALLGIAILSLSKAFIDYSTSGLENPLTHLILVAFLFIYLEYKLGAKTLLLLSFVAALGMVNRMDTALLFLPVLGYSLVRLRSKGLPAIVVGLTPVVLWESFSLFYYGFLFPNTAYAKLNTGIAGIDLANQGIYYLLDSLRMDPITLLIIALGVISPLVVKRWHLAPVAAGILLYLLYVVRIGGDFMSGRFLTAPLICAVILLSYSLFRTLRPKGAIAFGALLILIGLASPAPPPLSGADYGLTEGDCIHQRGIADERGCFYQASGLLNAPGKSEWPDHPWAQMGRQARQSRRPIVRGRAVGLVGFYAGPDVHILDLYALADPLLARLPVDDLSNWRIGHFERRIPEGYRATLLSGENVITDRRLATFYQALYLVTRGDLFDPRRAAEIWRLNTGAYDDLIESAAHSYR